ncbi:glutamate--cysteine ligase [Arthrobacter sp. D1-29]
MTLGGLRSFGVEEEFLLVDARTGSHAPVAESIVDKSGADAAARAGKRPGTGGAKARPLHNSLTGEVQREQLEAVSAPFEDLEQLAAALRAGREEADRQASRVGARIVPLGTSPLRVLPHRASQPRYRAMEERFGLILREQLMCGFHVHVSVASPEEGVAALDRIRTWLPVLIALSANSPFWQGQDTGYASFRYQVWRRWPTAGPTEVFGSASAYEELVQMLLSCDVLLDGAMIYFDARLSASYPTVEVRVPDVCTEPDHAVALAAITRALVETAARDWSKGVPLPPVPAEMLRLASWRASRFGLSGDLIHPVHNRPSPARECVEALLSHTRDALSDAGDLTFVTDTVARILAEGNGAERQMAVFSRTGNLRNVVLDAMNTPTLRPSPAERRYPVGLNREGT